MLSLAGRYTLGPDVSVEGVLWTAEIEGNTTDTSLDDNDGTGAVVGLIVEF